MCLAQALAKTCGCEVHIELSAEIIYNNLGYVEVNLLHLHGVHMQAESGLLGF